MSSVGTFVTRLLNIKSPGQFRGHHLWPSDGQTGAEIERRRNAQGLTDRPELRTCQAGCLRGHEAAVFQAARGQVGTSHHTGADLGLGASRQDSQFVPFGQPGEYRGASVAGWSIPPYSLSHG